VSLKACSDNEAEVGSAVEMRCHNTICANRVSPIQLVLIINTSLSNRYLFIELRVHAATHVHAHTPYTPLLESQRRQRVADSITFSSITRFKWSSNISVAGCRGYVSAGFGLHLFASGSLLVDFTHQEVNSA